MSEYPYPGLRPFRSDEADIFFGREEQTDQLLEKLALTRFISVVGLYSLRFNFSIFESLKIER
jgi:hypothetical protein